MEYYFFNHIFLWILCACLQLQLVHLVFHLTISAVTVYLPVSKCLSLSIGPFVQFILLSLSMHLSVCLSLGVHASVCVRACMCVSVCVYLPVNLPVCLSVHQSMHSSVRLSVCPSVHPTVCWLRCMLIQSLQVEL